MILKDKDHQEASETEEGAYIPTTLNQAVQRLYVISQYSPAPSNSLSQTSTSQNPSNPEEKEEETKDNSRRKVSLLPGSSLNANRLVSHLELRKHEKQKHQQQLSDPASPPGDDKRIKERERKPRLNHEQVQALEWWLRKPSNIREHPACAKVLLTLRISDLVSSDTEIEISPEQPREHLQPQSQPPSEEQMKIYETSFIELFDIPPSRDAGVLKGGSKGSHSNNNIANEWQTHLMHAIDSLVMLTEQAHLSHISQESTLSSSDPSVSVSTAEVSGEKDNNNKSDITPSFSQTPLQLMLDKVMTHVLKTFAKASSGGRMRDTGKAVVMIWKKVVLRVELLEGYITSLFSTVAHLLRLGSTGSNSSNSSQSDSGRVRNTFNTTSPTSSSDVNTSQSGVDTQTQQGLEAILEALLLRAQAQQLCLPADDLYNLLPWVVHSVANANANSNKHDHYNDTADTSHESTSSQVRGNQLLSAMSSNVIQLATSSKHGGDELTRFVSWLSVHSTQSSWAAHTLDKLKLSDLTPTVSGQVSFSDKLQVIQLSSSSSYASAGGSTGSDNPIQKMITEHLKHMSQDISPSEQAMINEAIYTMVSLSLISPTSSCITLCKTSLKPRLANNNTRIYNKIPNVTI